MVVMDVVMRKVSNKRKEPIEDKYEAEDLGVMRRQTTTRFSFFFFHLL